MSSITDGLVEVSQKEFFAFIGTRNIHPRPARECSVWEDVRSREVVGKSTPGYGVWDIDGALPDPHRYFLAPEYAAAKVKS